MTDREFYDSIEWWSGRWKFGEAISFNHLTEDYGQMSETQRAMAAGFLRSLEYERFLDTRYWKAIRLHLSGKSKDRCQTCSARGAELHHRTYRNHGEEHAHLSDLVFFCGKCHGLIHEASAFMEGRQQ